MGIPPIGIPAWIPVIGPAGPELGVGVEAGSAAAGAAGPDGPLNDGAPPPPPPIAGPEPPPSGEIGGTPPPPLLAGLTPGLGGVPPPGGLESGGVCGVMGIGGICGG